MEMAETALGAALKDAGYDPSADELAVFTTGLLRNLKLDKLQASRRLAHEFSQHEDWYEQAIEAVRGHEDLCRIVSLLYVEARLRDMRGAVGGGQKPDASNGQGHAAPVNGSAQTVNHEQGGQQQHAGNGQILIASPAHDAGEDGQGVGAKNGYPKTASSPASSVQHKRRRELDIARDEKARIWSSVLDTFKLQDGTSYGDLHAGSLGRYKRNSLLDHTLLDLTEKYLGGRIPPGSPRIRDLVTAQKADELYKQARLMVEADHAA